MAWLSTVVDHVGQSLTSIPPSDDHRAFWFFPACSQCDLTSCHSLAIVLLVHFWDGSEVTFSPNDKPTDPVAVVWLDELGQ